jgi:hypothetical protein
MLFGESSLKADDSPKNLKALDADPLECYCPRDLDPVIRGWAFRIERGCRATTSGQLVSLLRRTTVEALCSDFRSSLMGDACDLCQNPGMC